MLIYRTAVEYKLKVRKFEVKKKNRSFCDYCGKMLSWYENIPIVSWVIQKGKTRCCQKKLPISYPIIEFVTGFLFLIFFKFNFLINIQLTNLYVIGIFIIGIITITLLSFSAFFDLKYLILPNFSTYILILTALMGIFLNGKNLIPYLLSAIGASGFLYILNLITKGEGMGLGDVKFAIFMGLFLDWQKTILAFYIAFITGAILGLTLILLKKAKRNTIIPFGPFLVFGTVIAWWFGSNMINLFNLWL